MACCTILSELPTIQDPDKGIMAPEQQEYRESHMSHLYTASFNQRPLLVTLTSRTDAVGAFITAVEHDCPVDVQIELNSKVMAVNGSSLDGLYIDRIVGQLSSAEVPITLELMRPAGLEEKDYPDPSPDDFIHLYKSANLNPS